MESGKEIPSVNKIELKNDQQQEFAAKVTKNAKHRHVLEDLRRGTDVVGYCPENVDDNETEAELMGLKELVALKKKEHLVMSKSNEDLERKVDQLVKLVMSREQEEENQQLKQKLDEDMGNTYQGNEFQENRMIEQLLISNDDLTKECEDLKKKLNETNGSLDILEEKMNTLRAAKLREIEKSNSLSSELALSEAKVLHLEQLARVEIRKMMSESSSHRSGSFRQNTSAGFESSSLRSGSFRQSASLKLESLVAKTKQKLLGPTSDDKEQDLIQEIPPPLNTEKEWHKPTDLKIDATFAPEVQGPPLSPTVLIKKKVMLDFEDSKFLGEGKSAINFHEMDDEQLCQYQIKLLEARDSHDEKIDTNPEELEAEIEELNLYLSGEARKIPEAVPSRPCSVKFLSRGWGMTLTKAWTYFTGFHGVTGVKVVKDIVVVAFNTPEDAWAVIDKDPHVVTGCHLVPGPVTMLEDEDGVKESEEGAEMIDQLAGEEVPASYRTVEFFMIGKVINEELLKSIPGVESFSLDGKCVRLVFREKSLSEDMLNKGTVVVGGDHMPVGRVGQLGWVEVKVTGGTGVVDPRRLRYLLQNAGLSPLVDIQNRGGGIFGIVLENVKCRKLIKKGKLRLGSGFMLKVVDGEKQLDLGAGEELVGKMIISSEENFDTEGSSVLCQLKNNRKDINDNIVDDASDPVERKNEDEAKDSLNMSNKCPGINDEPRSKKAFNRSLGCSSSSIDAFNRSLGCSSSGIDEKEAVNKCPVIDDKLKPNEAFNRSLGSTGIDEEEVVNKRPGIDDKLKPNEAFNRSLGSRGIDEEEAVNKCPGIDDKLKHSEAVNRSLGCSSSGIDEKEGANECAGIDDKLKPNEAFNRSLGSRGIDEEEAANKCAGIDDKFKHSEAFNRSLGCSSSGTDDDDDEDCPQYIQHPTNNKSVVEVVKMSLTPRIGQKPVEDEAGYRSLNWSSAGSLNDSVDAEDSRDEGEKSDKVMANTSIKVVRIALAPKRLSNSHTTDCVYKAVP